jgi:group I intron endonuclease
MLGGIIYKATNTTNGKMYIGKTTKGLSRRRTEHISFTKPNTVFQHAIRKYGKSAFIWEIICECSSSEELINAEKEMIAKYQSNKLGIGYNMTSGGDGFAHGKDNPVHRPDVQEKIIAKLKTNNGSFRQEVRDKISKTLTGRKLSEEHKRSIAMAALGHAAAKGASNSKSKEWNVIFPDGHIEKIKGLRAFCREYLLNEKLMRRTARGESKHHKNFKLIQIND